MSAEKQRRHRRKKKESRPKKRIYQPPAIVEETVFARLAQPCNAVTDCFYNSGGS